MKKLLLMVLCIAMVSFAGCKEKPSTTTYEGPEDGVMSINGEPVSFDEFRYFLIMASYDIASAENMIEADRTGFWEKTDDETGMTFGQLAMNRAIDDCSKYHIYRTESQKQGIKLSKEDKEKIEYDANGIVEKYSEKMYELQMKAGGLTTEVHRDITEMGYYSTLLHSKFFNEYDKIPDEDIKKYFEENYVTAKNILVMTIDPETQTELSEEGKAEALKRIDEAAYKLQHGEKFSSVSDTYNEDTGVEQYPFGYTFSMKDDYSEIFKETAFALDIDEVSEVVESEFGYHIIKRVPLNMDDLENKRSDIMGKIIDASFEKEIEKYKSEAVIITNGNVYNSINIEEVLNGYLSTYDRVLEEIRQEFIRLDNEK